MSLFFVLREFLSLSSSAVFFRMLQWSMVCVCVSSCLQLCNLWLNCLSVFTKVCGICTSQVCLKDSYAQSGCVCTHTDGTQENKATSESTRYDRINITYDCARRRPAQGDLLPEASEDLLRLPSPSPPLSS